MLQREVLDFQSDFGKNIYTLYRPLKSNGVVMQIAHGMIEERSKYEEFARLMAMSGYVVAISDHRGHGESIGGKSGKYEVKLGEMGEDGFEKAVKDLHQLTEILKKTFENHRLILLGHSMGSLLSRRYLQLYENELDALILMGTPSPNFFAGIGARLCRFFEALGWHQMGVKIMNALSLTSFNRKFQRHDPSNPSYAWLTRELKEAESYMQREEYNFSFTLNSFYGLFEGLKKVFSAYPNVKKSHLPILFLSGEDDPCGEFGKGVYKAYKHLVSQGYKNVEMRLYSGARHELLLERNKGQIMNAIKHWCDQLEPNTNHV